MIDHLMEKCTVLDADGNELLGEEKRKMLEEAFGNVTDASFRTTHVAPRTWTITETRIYTIEADSEFNARWRHEEDESIEISREIEVEEGQH